MAMVRRKVLMQFTRNVGGSIVSGHPEHPDENGRFLVLDESVANYLADEGLIGDEDTSEKMPDAREEADRRRDAAANSIKGAVKDALADLAKEGTQADNTSQSAAQTSDSNTIAGLIAEGEGKGVGGGNTGAANKDGEGADGSVAGGRNASQTVRERRVAGKPTPADQKVGGRGQRGGATAKTKAPAGGDTTNATTQHPIESGPQTAPAAIPGNASESDEEPDAAPTGGS